MTISASWPASADQAHTRRFAQTYPPLTSAIGLHRDRVRRPEALLLKLEL